MNLSKGFSLVAIAVLAMTSVVVSTDAQVKKDILLWEKGAPGALGKNKNDQPQLLIRIPKKCNRTAVVILPGGGYRHLAMGHEGHEIAAWLNELGIAAFICDYRHRGKGYGHPAPMLDAQRAIQLVRSNAKEWGVAPERVGVIGFSAGGHLASTVSNHFDESEVDSDDPVTQMSSRPDFSILCYPVITFGQSYSHRGSRINLFGQDAKKEMVQKYSNEKRVTKKTPPTFLWSTADDKVVKVENSLQYFAALRKNQVPCALHVFPTGRHGLGLAKGNESVGQWPKLCESWLKQQGLLQPRESK